MPIPLLGGKAQQGARGSAPFISDMQAAAIGQKSVAPLIAQDGAYLLAHGRAGLGSAAAHALGKREHIRCLFLPLQLDVTCALLLILLSVACWQAWEQAARLRASLTEFEQLFAQQAAEPRDIRVQLEAGPQIEAQLAAASAREEEVLCK